MRKNHWKDFVDNTVKPTFIKNTNNINTFFVDKGEIFSNILNGCEKNVKAQRLDKLEHPVEITRINVESAMNEADIKNESSSLQIETTDIASSISKFFDKKPKSKSKPLGIYFTKCPCRRCQTLRRVNRLTSSYTFVDQQNKF